MVDEAMFHAWLDGELDPAEAAAIAAEVAANPALQLRAEQVRRLGEQLRAGFAPVAAEPVPERLTRAITAPAVVDLTAERARRERRRFALPQLAALAATLAVGIATGVIVAGGAAEPLAVEDGRLVAADRLDEALTVQLASHGEKEGIRLGLSFRDKSGAMCRSFLAVDWAGFACRSGGHWAVRGLLASPPQAPGDYRMASSPQLAQLIDPAMAGEPLDSAGERAARERGWR